MTEQFQQLKAVVFDWAGTVIDHGCLAPAIVFQEIFRRRGITVTPEQAREPMGMAKRAHIAAIAAMPEISAAWLQQHGEACSEEQIDAMYADFLPLQKQTLKDHSTLIDGATEVVEWCRQRGLKIGSSTGYTRELMEVVSASAAAQGYVPDCVLCSEDAPEGRPAPWLLHEAAKRMNVYPMWKIVKVDDTPVGIAAGRNAGCWTIGITRTGNGVGLSVGELQKASVAAVTDLISKTEAKLRVAGAHYVVESVADIRSVLSEIEQRLAESHVPI
ncbi:MAG: phosphonoacetaldehyde hydrolase [Planctomycetaceae bacterium]|nr:phosphonoacetaldehyde hydrolase [Planctomycetaceae bacterium]